jgi:hypothetical protein
MAELYIDEFLDIKLDKNKLIYTIYTVNKLPDIDTILKIQNILTIFFETLSKSNKQFYQIFIFNKVNISSLLNFTDCVEIMTAFFLKQHLLFKKLLLCSIMVLDNSLIKNSMNLIFKIYTPTRPLHFINDKNEIEDCINIYKNIIK